MHASLNLSTGLKFGSTQSVHAPIDQIPFDGTSHNNSSRAYTPIP
ncbi:MAG: hypothetical protein ACKN85_01405 [Pirellula sp.]